MAANSPQGAVIPGKSHALWLHGSFLLLIVAVLYATLGGVVYYDYVNWDDPLYVTADPLIKDISTAGIARIFSTAVAGNYHPLTILSYALEFHWLGRSSHHFHLINLLLHIGGACMVYWFAWLLSRNVLVAVATALLFGLHPMHVESFVWISGRKDVLYAPFYFGACIAYWYYLNAAANGRARFYILTILLFLFSVLSKPVAVILPVTLLVIDYWQHKQWSWQYLRNKIPFFVLSLLFGVRSVFDQHSYHAIRVGAPRSIFYQPLMGFYALGIYAKKLILPFNLSCFYPYPKEVDGAIVGTAVFALLLLLAVWRFFRKERIVVFGSLFFLANIILLLQFFPVGGAVVADRYTYVAYFGPFFIAAMFFARAVGATKDPLRIAFACLPLSAFIIFFAIMARSRCDVWADSSSLWQNEHEQFPDDLIGCQNLGMDYYNLYTADDGNGHKKVYADSAYGLLAYVTQTDTTNKKNFLILGDIDRLEGNDAKARAYYNFILTIDNEFASAAYYGLGSICWVHDQLDSARNYYEKAIALNSFFPEAHNDFGNYLDRTGHTDLAVIQYDSAIKQKPEWYAPYYNRGKALQKLDKNDEALADFNKAISMQPSKADIYYYRSFCYANKDQFAQAKADVDTAMAKGFKDVDTGYYREIAGHAK